jgi:glycosyltransferase involved in cell wall biosynthesis
MPEELLYEGGADNDVAAATSRLRRLARFVDAGIGVTDEISDYLRRDLGIPRTYCVPNGSDPELFSPPPDVAGNSDPLTVAWIGSSERGWHALGAFVNAAAMVHQAGANVRFVIFGDPRHLPPNLPPNIACQGVVAYAEMGKALAAADVGVHIFKALPNGKIMGALPLKIFDYMAAGLAVVAQEAGQKGAVIRRWNAGLFTTGGPQDIADKIMLLERDRALCRQLGLNGRRAVLEYYNWSRAAAETEAILMETLGQRERG